MIVLLRVIVQLTLPNNSTVCYSKHLDFMHTTLPYISIPLSHVSKIHMMCVLYQVDLVFFMNIIRQSCIRELLKEKRGDVYHI